MNAALLTQPNPGDVIFCVSFSEKHWMLSCFEGDAA